MGFSFEGPDQTGMIILKGELSIQQASRLKEMLSDSLTGAERLRINVEQIKGIDLSCLQVLCSAHRTAICSQKSIAVAGTRSEGFRRAVEGSGYAKGRNCGSPESVSCLWKSGECNE
jgi:ABC-type transporter Mla MlaB component